jgi:fructose-1,6-bisphosphatase/inositol monophosphatase family enzyme
MIINNQFFIDIRNFLKTLSDKYLLPNAGNLDQLNVTFKDDNSKVTQYDLLLENELLSFFNQKGFDNIISEETNNELLNYKSYLTIDPIDGTKNFIDGIKKFVIMISYIENNSSIFSIIYNPSNDNFYHSYKNKIFKNFNILNNFAYSELIGYLSNNARLYYKDLISCYREIPRSRSIGYDIIEIIEGERSLISFYKCKIWDLFPALSFLLNLNFKSNVSDLDFNLNTLNTGLIFYAKI